jgi:hypothetical protein
VAWLWVLIAVVVIIGVIVVVLVLRYMGRRGSVVTGGWLAQAIDVYAKGTALHDDMRAAVQPGAPATAAVRWADLDRRADALAQALSAMRDTGADPEDRTAAASALAALQSVRSAVEAYHAASGHAEQAEVVRGRLAGFELSLRALRAPDPHLW